MTDRFAGFIVTLAADLRDDDAEEIVTALKMVRGVTAVEPVVANVDIRIAEARADDRWRARLLSLIRDTDRHNLT